MCLYCVDIHCTDFHAHSANTEPREGYTDQLCHEIDIVSLSIIEHMSTYKNVYYHQK